MSGDQKSRGSIEGARQGQHSTYLFLKRLGHSLNDYPTRMEQVRPMVFESRWGR